MVIFNGRHFEKQIVLWGVRWSVAYPISDRQQEEMLRERGGDVDPATLNRWVIKHGPALEQEFRRRTRRVDRSWRMDETYVRVKEPRTYLYHAVDKAGHTVDFLLRPTHDRAAATAFVRQAIRHHGRPETTTIDQSGSNTAAIQSYNRIHHTGIAIRQCKYLNNLVEQDHRAVKRLVRPMLGFKSFEAAQCTLAGIEVMHAIHKGQLAPSVAKSPTPAEHFYALTA